MTAAVDILLYLPMVAIHWWPFLAVGCALLVPLWPSVKEAVR